MAVRMQLASVRARLTSALCKLIALICLMAPAMALWAFDPPSRIRFGGDMAYPPQEWLERNQAQGFNVELARELARVGGSRAEFKLGTWPEAILNLEVGVVDVVPMFYSTERAQRFIFTTPFYYSNHSLYAMPTTGRITQLSQLAGRRVAVEKSSFAEQQLRAQSQPPILILTASTLDALQALVDGRADYAVLASLPADLLKQEHDLAPERLGPPFWSRGYAFAVNRSNPELAKWLQDALDQLVTSGRFQEIYQEWSAQLEPGGGHFNGHRQILLICAALVAALLLIGSWWWSLKYMLARRMRDLTNLQQVPQKNAPVSSTLPRYEAQTGLYQPDYFLDQIDAYVQTAGAEPRELLLIKLMDLEPLVLTLGAARVQAKIVQIAANLRNRTEPMAAYLGRGVFGVFMAPVDSALYLEQLLPGAPQSGVRFNVRLVGGSAYWPEQGRTAARLMRAAETALAATQPRRRTWVAYEPELEPNNLDLDLLTAFVQDNLQGLYPVFQPQLNLHSGRIESAEAQVRLEHPRLGAVPPAVFMPLLESAGLVEAVTDLIIDEAVRVAAQLRRLNLPCTLAVKLTARDLTGANLSTRVSQSLVRHQGSPKDLVLELPEAGLAMDPVGVRKLLLELSELGVTIAVDDFGGSLSSLSYLTDLPVSELKIDRQFIGDLATNNRHQGIVRSIILMARESGLLTIAEGVEDAPTLELLRLMACDLVQGYLVAQPLPEAKLMDFLRARRSE